MALQMRAASRPTFHDCHSNTAVDERAPAPNAHTVKAQVRQSGLMGESVAEFIGLKILGALVENSFVKAPAIITVL
jgi:hypothetical protein